MKTLLLSMRVTESESYQEERSSIAYEYINFFESMGFIVYLIPNNTGVIEKYLELDADLIVLSGGNNVNPLLYKSDDFFEDVHLDRDRVEAKLLDFAIEKQVNILGICRGFHFMNVYFGGKLIHNIDNHVNKEHALISKNKLLSDTKVNSFHNHAITRKTLSNELISIAETDDGIVECAIHLNGKILGVQWHPERQKNSIDKNFISQFMEGKL